MCSGRPRRADPGMAADDGANGQRLGEVGERRRAVFVFGPVEGIINQGWPRDRARKSLCVRARRCRPGKVFSK